MSPRRRRYPVLRLVPSVFGVLLAALSCGPPPQPTPLDSPKHRAVWLSPANWAHADADSAAARIRGFATAVALGGSPTLLVPVDAETGAASPDGFDPLAVAIDGGHAHGLGVHAGLTLSVADGEPPAAARARWKEIARHVATHYEVDGLYFSESRDRSAVGAAAEALLVKPYLVVSASSLRHVIGLAPVHGVLAPDDTMSWRAKGSQVVGLNLTAWLTSGAADRVVHVDSAAHEPTTDANGHLVILLPDRPDTLRVVADGDTLALETRFWKPPYNYSVTAAGTVTRSAPWVELRAAPPTATTRDTFEFLGHTDSLARATINGVGVKVYATGVFFDSLALAKGRNRIRLEARWPDGRLAVYEEEFERRIDPPRPPLPLWIDEKSVEPGDSLTLLPTDVVRLSFRGSPGQKATAHIKPGGLELPFGRIDGEHSATYSTDLHLSRLKPGRSYRVEIRLHQAGGGSRIRHRLANPIEVRRLHELPLVITSAPESYVSWSLGAVRLGGPYVAEYPEGVVLQTTGRFGRRYRVRFGPHSVGYIHERYVDVAPGGTVMPRYHLRSISASATDSTDVVRIPRPEPVPYIVRSDPDGRRIVVTLYGVQTSSTWLAHRSGMRYVDRVTWRQLDAETYEATLHLKTDRIWGYDVRPDGRSLVVTLRHPPSLSPAADQPLAGLKIAIEAGHGGSSTGAIGLSGLLERDVNLATALLLADSCEAAGAEVIQLRDGFDGIPYMARRDSVRASGADVFISVHANAAGGGFLRAGGTCTFYHDPFWAPLATHIYGHMLDLGLGEFGTVGSFNYRPTRMSSVPSVLVEQAFMSHAEDEEFLSSEAGRQAIAGKILAGLLDWLAEQPVDTRASVDE